MKMGGKTRILSLIFLVFAGYLIVAGFNLIKKSVGNGTLSVTEPQIVSPGEDDQSNGLGFLNLAEGFKISVAAKDLTSPRVILFDTQGRMLVSETKAGRVSILEDKDQDGQFEEKRTLIANLRLPHGLAFYALGNPTYLYVAETHQVARYPYDENTGRLTSEVGENIATLPPEGQHFTRTIAFGPNWRDRDLVKGNLPVGGFYSALKLYISVGSSCDVCLETTWKRAAILESDPEGTFTGEFAGGLRNTVFFTFHPETKEIWATEMGRDDLGDNLPSDEINIVKVAEPEHKFGARRFGWPFCYGNKVKDETFKPEKIERIDLSTDCSETEEPIIELPAHSAPLGLAFITSERWPKEWKNDLLVAYHGSWNRSEPTGYKVVKFDLDKNGQVLSPKPADFISGWLKTSNQIYGRPVDLKFDSEGALYLSDDAAGIIYKIEPTDFNLSVESQ